MSPARRAACVIGYPAKHSRSPKLHGYWIAKYGLDADYRAEEIPPEEIEDFLKHLAARGYVGANVTMPHKDIAFALSQPDAAARAIGAANTLWLEDGRLKATNTDAEGFIGSLDASAPGWDQRTQTAVVLGAGGAARAVVYGLLERGIEHIVVVNRTLAKAEELCVRFGARVQAASWDQLSGLLANAQLAVNATSLGMHGQPELEIDLSLMPQSAVVSDIVYVPLRTPLLAAAEARGFATSNGLDMLLHQAVRGFELWFGVRPEVTQELYDLLAADISKA
jgi:shikimate dehydrogenase